MLRSAILFPFDVNIYQRRRRGNREQRIPDKNKTVAEKINRNPAQIIRKDQQGGIQHCIRTAELSVFLRREQCDEHRTVADILNRIDGNNRNADRKERVIVKYKIILIISLIMHLME